MLVLEITTLYLLEQIKLHGEMTELAEGARLEIVCGGNSTEGSNPSLSARKPTISGFLFYYFFYNINNVLTNF